MSRAAPTPLLQIDGLARAFPAGGVVGARNALEAGSSSDVAIGDWDDLLSAVKSRLRLTVGELLAALPEGQVPDAAHRVQASVLECVTALDQLQLTLSHEFERRQLLELELVETRTALAQARAEPGAMPASVPCAHAVSPAP
jgi:hypothetical protein